MAAVTKEDVLAALTKLCTPLGAVTGKAMFGGLGVFCEGTMFALITRQGELYFKADDQNRPAYEQAGLAKGSIRESYASPCYGGGETGPVIGAGGEADEVEPAQVVVQIAGGDAAAGTQEVLQPAVAAVHRSAHADRPEPVPPSCG